MGRNQGRPDWERVPQTRNEGEGQDEFLHSLPYLLATRGYPEVTTQGAIMGGRAGQQKATCHWWPPGCWDGEGRGFLLHCFMFLALELSLELADPGRSKARNNTRELSKEQPAARGWERRMGMAYAAARRFSEQPCSEGQGMGGYEIIGKFKNLSKSFRKLCTRSPLCMEPLAEEAWRAQLNPKHTLPPQMALCTL